MVGNEFCRSFVQYFVGVELRNFRFDDIVPVGQIVSTTRRKVGRTSEQSVSKKGGGWKNKRDPSRVLFFRHGYFLSKFRKIEFKKSLLGFILGSALILQLPEAKRS